MIKRSNQVVRTKWYKLIGDIYEYDGQDITSIQRTYTDNGWRLRSKKYGSTATFANKLLKTSLEKKNCPLNETQSGIYILRDLVFPNGFYIGKGKCIHDRLWKHGVKLAGTSKWNKGVKDTTEFLKYRTLRLNKDLNNLKDIEVAFWFIDEIDALEAQLLGAYISKYHQLPLCNDKKEIMFDSWDI